MANYRGRHHPRVLKDQISWDCAIGLFWEPFELASGGHNYCHSSMVAFCMSPLKFIVCSPEHLILYIAFLCPNEGAWILYVWIFGRRVHLFWGRPGSIPLNLSVLLTSNLAIGDRGFIHILLKWWTALASWVSNLLHSSSGCHGANWIWRPWYLGYYDRDYSSVSISQGCKIQW